MAYENENLEALVSYFKSGATTNPGGLGVEIEHFVVYADTLEDVPYEEADGSFGVAQVLAYLAQFFPNKSYGTDGSLIGLASDKGTVTLEPASQLELSIAPYRSVAEVKAVYDEFRSKVDPYLESKGAKLVAAGYHPKEKALDLPLIPKRRYHFMDTFFKTIGTHGARMMRATASTQVSIDFVDEADAVRKMRVAQALAPILASLTDNTPVFEGESAITPLVRFNVWRDVDNARTGSVPGIFNEGWGFKDYAVWLLRISPIFITRTAADDPDGENMRTFFDVSSAEAYGDAPMSEADVEHLISMVWPDVRLKKFIEIRPADSLPEEKLLGYTALIKGIFYSNASLSALEEAFGVVDGLWPLDDSSTNKALALIREQGDSAVFSGKSLGEWKSFVLVCAESALTKDEASYLNALRD